MEDSSSSPSGNLQEGMSSHLHGMVTTYLYGIMTILLLKFLYVSHLATIGICIIIISPPWLWPNDVCYPLIISSYS